MMWVACNPGGELFVVNEWPHEDFFAMTTCHHSISDYVGIIAAEETRFPQKVHDRIIGIDGQLLAMKSPNRDLRRRWRESEAQPGPTLRVERKGKLLDITHPRTERDALLSKVLVAPAEALRQLAALTQTVDFATLETPLTESGQFAARLSLRFPDE